LEVAKGQADLSRRTIIYHLQGLSFREYLQFEKNLTLSTFDLERGVLTLNKDKFDSSMAKREIEELISDIVKVEDEYEEELRRWEAEQELDKFSQQDDKEVEGDDEFADEVDSDDDIQSLISKTAEREEDLSNLTPRELQDLIDDALDAGDFDEVKRLSSYLKEGREIYLREIERINEKYLKRK
jgi:hypothetical protein